MCSRDNPKRHILLFACMLGTMNTATTDLPVCLSMSSIFVWKTGSTASTLTPVPLCGIAKHIHNAHCVVVHELAQHQAHHFHGHASAACTHEDHSKQHAILHNIVGCQFTGLEGDSIESSKHGAGKHVTLTRQGA